MLGFRSHASLFCALASAIAAIPLYARGARACGGCFHPPPTPTQLVGTVVTDHRMAFSLSTAQTVLWDQIEYTGNPSEFAWVLPVRPGATIELSQDAWLAALDASTQTVIIGPASNCAPPPTQGGGCAFLGGSSSENAGSGFGSAGAEGAPAVQVLSQQVVGPYDAVTVRASQGEALGAWLDANGFAVPPALQPTIDAFTAAGFDFIALKLRPGESVQAMQPVRVVAPGADPSLPLRMVAAGVGANVTIELFVLSEGRYHPQNFPDATIDFSKLEWDPTRGESTYTTLMQAALSANAGTGWLTEFSGPADLGVSSSGPNPTLLSAYAAQCTPVPASCAPAPSPGGYEAEGGEEASSGAGATGIEGSPGGEAGDSAGGLATADASDDANTTATVCTTAVTCDDLDLAMTGIATGGLWVTRLRAALPASALSADLVLEATSSQVPVPNVHTTSTYTIPNYNPCPASASSGGGCRVAAPWRTPPGDAVAFALAVAGVGVAAGRRRRR